MHVTCLAFLVAMAPLGRPVAGLSGSPTYGELGRNVTLVLSHGAQVRRESGRAVADGVGVSVSAAARRILLRRVSLGCSSPMTLVVAVPGPRLLTTLFQDGDTAEISL